jgi:hypothetical protein
LFEAAGKDNILPELISPPRREEYTGSGNRIDLIAEGESWILVIEDKIRHTAANPFDDYKNNINSCYNKKSKIFILLTVSDGIAPKNWIWVTYEKFIGCLKKNIGFYTFLSRDNNKWHVIMREFILNIQSEYGDNRMDKERIDFVKNNYSEIQELNDMLNEYIQHMKSRGLDVLNSKSKNSDMAFSGQHNWGEQGTALRLKSKDWSDNTNITLLLRRDGSFRIQFYVYDIMDERIDDLKSHIDLTKYKSYWIELRTVQCFGYFDSRNDDEILLEIGYIAERLNSFFASKT